MDEVRIPLEFIGECVMIINDSEGRILNTSKSGEDVGDLVRAYIECDDIRLENGETIREADSKQSRDMFKKMRTPTNMFSDSRRMRVPLWFGELSEIAIPVEES